MKKPDLDALLVRRLTKDIAALAEAMSALRSACAFCGALTGDDLATLGKAAKWCGRAARILACDRARARKRQQGGKC